MLMLTAAFLDITLKMNSSKYYVKDNRSFVPLGRESLSSIIRRTHFCFMYVIFIRFFWFCFIEKMLYLGFMKNTRENSLTQ